MFKDEQRIYGPLLIEGKEWYGDPGYIHRVLTVELDGNVNDWIDKYNSDFPAETSEATEKICLAVLKAFRIEAFDPATGAGTTEDELISLFVSFFDWVKKKPANIDRTPTSLPATGRPIYGPPAGTGPAISQEKPASVCG